MADTIPKQYKGVVYNEPGKISTKVETLDMPYAHLPTVVPLHRMLDIELGLWPVAIIQLFVNFMIEQARRSPRHDC